MAYWPIEDYGIVGNMRTAALIRRRVVLITAVPLV